MAEPRNLYDFSQYHSRQGTDAPNTGSQDAAHASVPSVDASSPWEGGEFFNHQPGDSAPMVPGGSPPFLWLGAAAASAVIGALLALVLRGEEWPAGLAWLLTGPLAIGLLTVFSAGDTRQRSRPTYTSPARSVQAYWLTVALTVVGLVAACWRLADWFGRR